jgi:hypothetical protein
VVREEEKERSKGKQVIGRGNLGRQSSKEDGSWKSQEEEEDING